MGPKRTISTQLGAGRYIENNVSCVVRVRNLVIMHFYTLSWSLASLIISFKGFKGLLQGSTLWCIGSLTLI